MRNNLAEEALDSDMHHLMLQYKNSLGEIGTHLERTIIQHKQIDKNFSWLSTINWCIGWKTASKWWSTRILQAMGKLRTSG
jgi:hypothetical protein